MHEALALAVGGALELRPFDAGLLREALQRLGRLAVGVERDVEIGAEHFGTLFGLLDADAGQQHGEAARRVQRFRFAALEDDAAPGQRIGDAVEEGLRQTGQGLAPAIPRCRVR